MNSDIITFLILLGLLVLLFLTWSVSAFRASVLNLSDSERKSFDEKYKARKKSLHRYHDNSALMDRTYEFLSLFFGFSFEILICFLLYRLDSKLVNAPGLVLLCVFIGLILFCLLGVYIPYYIYSTIPSRRIYFFLGVFHLEEVVFRPLIYLMSKVAHLISRPYAKKGSNPDDVTEEEILTMVNEGSEQGNILSSEAEMVQNVLELDNKDVKDIMVHRNEIEAMDGNLTVREAIQFFQENHYSRIPVYSENLDHILGIIHIKDVLQYATRPDMAEQKICNVKDLIRPAETVPETHGVHTLFSTMQLEKTHMAIVVDEYGQTCGLVSMEDIIEEIVGNIQDEHDEEEDAVIEVRHDEFRMDGRTSLDEVSETLSCDFHSPEFETLNGYLTDAIGRVPSEHEHFVVERKGFRFEVLDVTDRLIREVCVTRLPKEPEPGGDSLDS